LGKIGKIKKPKNGFYYQPSIYPISSYTYIVRENQQQQNLRKLAYFLKISEKN
jgi:hypothetical protein